MDISTHQHNMKQNKLKITKYISLTIIISFVCFVGSIIGFKVVEDINLGNTESAVVNSFMGIFSTTMFLFVSFWLLIGSFTALYGLLKSPKRTFLWKIFGLIFLLIMFASATIAITFYIYFLIDIIKYAKSIKLNGSWFESMGLYFKEHMQGDKKTFYLIVFIFSCVWSIAGILFNIAYKTLGNHIKAKKVTSENKIINEESKIEFKENEENTNNDLKTDEKENSIKTGSLMTKENEEVKNETKEEFVPLVEQEIKKEEDDWLTEKTQTNNDNEIKKEESTPHIKRDENDPYSIFD